MVLITNHDNLQGWACKDVRAHSGCSVRQASDLQFLHTGLQSRGQHLSLVPSVLRIDPCCTRDVERWQNCNNGFELPCFAVGTAPSSRVSTNTLNWAIPRGQQRTTSLRYQVCTRSRAPPPCADTWRSLRAFAKTQTGDIMSDVARDSGGELGPPPEGTSSALVWLRHERMAIRMAVAVATHHSSRRRKTAAAAHDAPR